VTAPAVILVGGKGERLRPLTERMPKPLLPLLGRPILAYTLDHLATAGVTRVVLGCEYLAGQLERHFGRSYGGMVLDYSVEPEPLGTAGGMRRAADGIEETFFVLNGDSLCEADFDSLMKFHHSRGATATILLAEVENVSHYGVVHTSEQGRVVAFVEKPTAGDQNCKLINAGVYVLEPSVIEMIPPGRPVSIEHDVFPALAERGELYAVEHDGYWLDVGTPASYLQAHLDLLGKDPSGVMIDVDAEVDPHAVIGHLVYVGPGARVGRGAVLERAVVLGGAQVRAGERVEGAIVTPEAGVLRCESGAWA